MTSHSRAAFSVLLLTAFTLPSGAHALTVNAAKAKAERMVETVHYVPGYPRHHHRRLAPVRPIFDFGPRPLSSGVPYDGNEYESRDRVFKNPNWRGRGNGQWSTIKRIPPEYPRY